MIMLIDPLAVLPKEDPTSFPTWLDLWHSLPFPIILPSSSAA